MEFTSLVFLGLFLPLALFAYFVVPQRGRLTVICLFSLVFYAFAGWLAFAFLIATIVWGYLTTLFLERHRTLFALIVSISVPLIILIIAKYLGFLLDTFGAGEDVRAFFSPLLSLSLPPGVSFYTFHIVCYAVDVYDRKFQADRSLRTVSTYICFFPQLIAGPITRYLQIGPQLKALEETERPKCDYVAGIKLVCIGLFGKIIFADIVGTFLEGQDVPAHGGSLEVAFDILAYSLQIYYDFWAYSLMAIGLAKLFGVELPKNFDQPYLSRNPKEFWRRWHITLSFWLRDYVYLRIGGNKAYARNITIVFLLVGLWHGAGWNFVVWGAYHAFLILLYHYTSGLWNRLPDTLQVALTFVLVSLGWPLFKYDLPQTLSMWGTLFSFQPGEFSFSTGQWIYVLVILLATFLTREKEWIYSYRAGRFVDSPILHAVLAFLAIIFFPFAQTFIYFQF